MKFWTLTKNIFRSCFKAPKGFWEYCVNADFNALVLLFINMFLNGFVLLANALSNTSGISSHFTSPVSVLTFVSIASILHYLLRITKAPPWLKQIYTHTMFIIAFLLCFLPIVMAPSVIFGLIIITTFLIITCFSMHLHPFFFSLITVLAYTIVCLKEFHGIYFNYQNYSVNLFFLAGTLIIMSFYRRLNSVRHFHVDMILKKRSDNLEHQVLVTSIELNNQNEKLIKMQDDTIISLSNLVENRDSDTGQHVRRTRDYVVLLAKETRAYGAYKHILTDHYIELLSRAAPMHDIGKIVVSDAILKKPGRLTPEEFDQIKVHTIEGGKIVREILGRNQEEDFIKVTEEIVEGHHEKWDGSGYPRGLSGQDIPLSARIMALADVFDALTSPRCYKSSMPIEEALTIIKESAGSHFDPLLTEIFIANREHLKEILEAYNL